MDKHLHFTNGEVIEASITFPKQKYKYSPLEDITAYELALIVPIISSGYIYYIVDGLVDDLEYGVKRHFKEME